MKMSRDPDPGRVVAQSRGRPDASRWPLVLALLLGVGGCGDDAEAGAAAEEFQRVINVEVLSLEREDFEEQIRLTGTAQANQDVTLSAEEGGVIREILVEKGTVVEEGQALFRIDSGILEAQVAEAEARAGLARETWDRRRQLFEVDGVGSELTYLEARYQADQAEASLASLAERLDRTVIRAPITGILESREVEVGTMVSTGTPVARIVQIDPVKVVGGVPERFAADVSVGARATVSFDVLGSGHLQGQVQYVGATVNPRNRTFQTEVLFPNPNRVIKPEMIARVEINRRNLEDVVVVPQEALVRVEDGFVAFVAATANGEDIAEVRPLVLGPSQRNRVVIEEGLEPGDRLIVVGQGQVANGDRIQVVRTRESAPAPEGGDH